MDGGGRHAFAFRGINLPHAQAGANRLKCVARSDLRLPAPPGTAVDVGGPTVPRRARRDALGFEHLEPRPVHQFERQHELKALVGCRLKLARRAERLLAVQVGAVALKAQRRGSTNLDSPGGTSQPFAARRAQRARAFALQLATREGNPFVINDLRGCIGYMSPVLKSVS